MGSEIGSIIYMPFTPNTDHGEGDLCSVIYLLFFLKKGLFG